MFPEVLPNNARSALAALGESIVLKDAYLAGGTALAFQLGHRISVDFDFFTDHEFDAQQLIQKFTALPLRFQLERTAPGAIFGFFGDTKFSLFEYHYPLLEPVVSFMNIALASISDIAAMKLAAVADRGSRRDFIDLYVMIVVEKKLTFEALFLLYDQKFAVLQQNKMHLLKSLVYFDDAEADVMPQMLRPVEWRDVKKFFQNEVNRISKQYL